MTDRLRLIPFLCVLTSVAVGCVHEPESDMAGDAPTSRGGKSDGSRSAIVGSWQRLGVGIGVQWYAFLDAGEYIGASQASDRPPDGTESIRGTYTFSESELVLGTAGRLNRYAASIDGARLTLRHLDFGVEEEFMRTSALCETARHCYAQQDPPADAGWECTLGTCQPSGWQSGTLPPAPSERALTYVDRDGHLRAEQSTWAEADSFTFEIPDSASPAARTIEFGTEPVAGTDEQADTEVRLERLGEHFEWLVVASDDDGGSLYFSRGAEYLDQSGSYRLLVRNRSDFGFDYRAFVRTVP